jgi:hypothetical protein
LTVAVLLFTVGFASKRRVRDAARRRSPLAFYLAAAAVLFVCALGPRPAVNGHQFLYEPPYAWLMRLSIFGSVRVPARFAMPGLLALSLSGAIAFSRFTLDPRARRVAGMALMAGIAADGSIRGLAFPAPPETWPAARTEGFSSVLELPLGDAFDDLAAMYRSTVHGKPVLNGNSGFEPTHYFTLKTALTEHDPAIFEGLPPGRILVAVDTRHDRDGQWGAFLSRSSYVTRLESNDSWSFFSAVPPPSQPACAAAAIRIRSIRSNTAPVDLTALTDGRPETFWDKRPQQRAGEALVLELDRESHPCAVDISYGEFQDCYSRELIIDSSPDGSNWTPVARRRTAGLALRAALADPRSVTVSIPLEPSAGRFLRIQLGDSAPIFPWIVTDLAVHGN